MMKIVTKIILWVQFNYVTVIVFSNSLSNTMFWLIDSIVLVGGPFGSFKLLKEIQFVIHKLDRCIKLFSTNWIIY